ncbi:hypothetical protein NECAME_13007, partial [Necator americanus]
EKIKNKLSSLITAELPRLKYKCYNELIAALVLDDPDLRYEWIQKQNMFPLIGDSPEKMDVMDAVNAAMKAWKEYIHRVGKKTEFGCGYAKRDGFHRFFCILK